MAQDCRFQGCANCEQKSRLRTEKLAPPMPNKEDNSQWKQEERKARKKSDAAATGRAKNFGPDQVSVPGRPMFRLSRVRGTGNARNPPANQARKWRSIRWQKDVFAQPLGISGCKMRWLVNGQPGMLCFVQKCTGKTQQNQPNAKVLPGHYWMTGFPKIASSEAGFSSMDSITIRCFSWVSTVKEVIRNEKARPSTIR